MCEEFKKQVLENNKPRFRTYVKALCKNCNKIFEYDKSKKRNHKGYCKHCAGTEKIASLEGKIFGTLTVINRAENSKAGKARWNCACSCGNKTIAVGSALLNGRISSCGCLHGLPVKEYFMKHVKEIENGCWFWQGLVNKEGYGEIKFRGKQWRAHRLSYTIFNGEITKGMCVCHKCDTPGCVNPKCLFLGTNAMNSQDMVNKNRQVKGHSVWNAKLTEEIVKIIKEKLKTENNCAKLAKEFKVHRNTILCIKKNKTWKHVTI